MLEGYIKLHRKITEWEWYDDANTLRLFLHILLNANHTSKKWHGIEIESGELLTGRFKLAQALKLSEQQIRTSLIKLKLTNVITIKSTSQYSIITIKNWNLYQQNNQQNNQQITNEQPTNNQRITTTKNDKNDKKFIVPTIQQIEEYCQKRNNNIDAEYFFNYNSARGWMIGKNKMKDWKAAIRTWEARDGTKKKVTNTIEQPMSTKELLEQIREMKSTWT